MNRYIRFKEYNNDTIDLVLVALCNALAISAIIFQSGSSEVNVMAIGPGRPDVGFRGDIYLVLTGTDGNAHYSGVKKVAPNVEGSRATDNPFNPHDKPEVFSPEIVRPFPKAPLRKQTGG